MVSIGQLYWHRICRRKTWLVLAAALLGVGAAPERPPVRLLILGDSLSAGYGLAHADGFEVQLQDALKAQGHDVTIIDGAVSGDTSAGGRSRLDWTLGDGADAAIVELGANDGLRGIDPKSMGRISPPSSTTSPLGISRYC